MSQNFLSYSFSAADLDYFTENLIEHSENTSSFHHLICTSICPHTNCLPSLRLVHIPITLSQGALAILCFLLSHHFLFCWFTKSLPSWKILDPTFCSNLLEFYSNQTFTYTTPPKLLKVTNNLYIAKFNDWFANRHLSRPINSMWHRRLFLPFWNNFSTSIPGLYNRGSSCCSFSGFAGSSFSPRPLKVGVPWAQSQNLVFKFSQFSW